MPFFHSLHHEELRNLTIEPRQDAKSDLEIILPQLKAEDAFFWLTYCVQVKHSPLDAPARAGEQRFEFVGALPSILQSGVFDLGLSELFVCLLEIQPEPVEDCQIKSVVWARKFFRLSESYGPAESVVCLRDRKSVV